MKTVHRFVAWICLFSTTVMGCYTTSFIEPTGDGRQRIEKGEITRVVMKGGTVYEFDEPPIVVEEAITGDAKIKQSDGEYISKEVSLPITDVAEIHLSEVDEVANVVLAITLVAVMVVGVIAIGELSSLDFTY